MIQKRAALYVRVSTKDQTVENQTRVLTDAASRREWRITKTYSDVASGAKRREDRPGINAMVRDAGRGKFDVVMVWALDRLGRSTLDTLTTAQMLKSAGVELYIDQMQIDTTQPWGQMVFTIFAAVAQMERGIIRERCAAGIERFKAAGGRLGPPLPDPAKVEHARQLLADGMGIVKAGKIAGIGTSTVAKIKSGTWEVAA